MSNTRYNLYGFATGGAKQPQFLVPVFTSGNRQFVQVCDDQDRITRFENIEDSVGIIENQNKSQFTVGDKKVFALQEENDRLVVGDREFVNKYLEQNIFHFIDKPYFFRDALKFIGKENHIFEFLFNDKKLQASNAATNSIRRYINQLESQPVEKNSPRKIGRQKYLNEHFWRHVNNYFEEDRNIENSAFSRWLKFSIKDSPRLSKEPDWASLAAAYKECIPKTVIFDGMDIISPTLRHTSVTVKILLEALQTGKNTDNDLGSASTSDKSSADQLQVLNKMIDWKISSEISRQTFKSGRNPREINGMADKAWTKSIRDALNQNRVKTTQLTMTVYFVALSLRIILRKYESNNDTNKLARTLLEIKTDKTPD